MATVRLLGSQGKPEFLPPQLAVEQKYETEMGDLGGEGCGEEKGQRLSPEPRALHPASKLKS